ncbi:MAG: DUF1345 domain-containing protein, partial [Acidimicrobiia bacterium]|nr:DUF1345 domain-containing protein [Acidimicrobiia bacterium]
MVTTANASTEVRFALTRTRLAVAVVCGVIVFAVAMALAPWQVAVLGGWAMVGLVFAGWTISSLWTLNATDTADVATREDSSRTVADLLLLCAESASLAAVGVGLVKAGSSNGVAKPLITAL